jgi:undecaprenyl-diphosphatase
MEILKFLESIRSPFLDVVLGFITRFGEETIAIVVLCAIYWCISKKTAYIIGIAYFISGLTVQGMKICFRIDRPWVIDPGLNPVPSALSHATGYSFPSGHTQSATALLGSLGMRLKPAYLKTICFLLVLLVAFSRMYLGVHTLLDVSVSLMLTLLIILLTVRILGGGPADKKRDLILAVFMVLYAITVIITAFVLFNGGKIEQSYVSDCLKAAGAGIGYAVGMYIERTYIDFQVKAKNLFLQIVKFVLGLAGVLIIKEGLKLIIGTGLVVDTVRYFLMLAWVTVFFPLIIRKFFAKSI